MPKYDSAQFNPPAPVALVSVRSTHSNQQVADVPMLLDSGADVTLLPATFVKHLAELSASSPQYEVQAFDGSRSVASAAHFVMQFQRKTFRGQFLLIDQPCGVIGRNVLNSLTLVMDGPTLTWETR
jgi:hypothetical protein